MNMCQPTNLATHRNHRVLADCLSILLFLIAGLLLFLLENCAEHYAIGPHIALGHRVPVSAEVIGHDLFEEGTGDQGSVLPQVRYRYSFGDHPFESSIIRSPGFVNEHGEEGSLRFDGPNRFFYVQEVFVRYPVGQQVTAWVDPHDPRGAMLVRQELSFLPFLWGVLPTLFIPIIWVVFNGFLRMILAQHHGRWLAMGWSMLTFSGGYPVVSAYQQMGGDVEPGIVLRFLNLGLYLPAIIFVGSLLPRPFRSGLAVGLILCFGLLGGIGTATICFLGRFYPLVGVNTNPFPLLAGFLEYSLVCGIFLGLAIGIGSWLGVIWIRSDEELESVPATVENSWENLP